jgi:hypothetical protein
LDGVRHDNMPTMNPAAPSTSEGAKSKVGEVFPAIA